MCYNSMVGFCRTNNILSWYKFLMDLHPAVEMEW